MKPTRMGCDQLRILIVDGSGDLDLVLVAGEEHIWRRQRQNFHVYPHPVHVLQSLCRIAHWRGDAKETGTPKFDDRPSGRILVEREFGREVPDHLEERRGIIVGVQIKLHETTSLVLRKSTRGVWALPSVLTDQPSAT